MSNGTIGGDKTIQVVIALTVAGIAAGTSIITTRWTVSSQIEQETQQIIGDLKNRLAIVEERGRETRAIVDARTPYFERIVNLDANALQAKLLADQLRASLDRLDERLRKHMEDMQTQRPR